MRSLWRRRLALWITALGIVAACGGDPTQTVPTTSPSDTGTGLPSPTATSTPQGTNVVTVADNEFRPPEVTIVAGTEVVWTSTGAAPHSVTADDGSFDSHPECTGTDPSKCLGTGQAFRHTFATPGRFPYHCHVHGDAGGAGMSGILVVT
jgi:plastocyanin